MSDNKNQLNDEQNQSLDTYFEQLLKFIDDSMKFSSVDALPYPLPIVKQPSSVTNRPITYQKFIDNQQKFLKSTSPASIFAFNTNGASWVPPL